MKPYKVTISHFLNTNLKPFVMNGANYYPIYVMITAKRKTTKIRSLTFTEYYTEDDFNEIINSIDSEDINKVNNEISAINKIAEFVISELKEFNTTFFYAYIGYSDTINVSDIGIDFLSTSIKDNFFDTFSENDKTAFTFVDTFHYSENNIIEELSEKQILKQEKETLFGFGLNIIHSLITEKLNIVRQVTLFEFFSDEVQTIIKGYIEHKNLKYNTQEIIKDINKLYFFFSLENFKHYLNGSRKTKALNDKYNLLLSSCKVNISKYLIEKYKA